MAIVELHNGFPFTTPDGNVRNVRRIFGERVKSIKTDAEIAEEKETAKASPAKRGREKQN